MRSRPAVDTICPVGPRPPGGDLDLVTRAKEGDVDAYAVLLRRHEADARRLAAALCGTGSPDADEAAQEAFVKAWYGLGGFRDGAAFRPWLLRIVANEARNRRRARGRRAGYELRFATQWAVADPGPSPESAALATEARSDGERTWRLESALDREAAAALAEALTGGR